MIKAIIVVCAICAGMSVPHSSLSLTDPISRWPFASEAERERIDNLLVLLAGQGRPEMNELFFEKCISDLAWDPNLAERSIRDAADGCAYMSTLVFAEHD
jgi:hypothetical protein